MAEEQHRHDIGDSAWEKIRPYTIGEKGTRGGNARDTRQFTNGVFWILRTEAPWLDLPETYGNWKNVHRAADEGMTPVIPPKKNRKELREYNKYLYKLRHLVENAFLLLKHWRGIAAYCAKNDASFVAAVQIRCIAIWLLLY